MPRGPLPGGATRRRNAPTITNLSLPSGGRKGRVPKPPSSYKLGEAGKAWWQWAWKLPQAHAWDVGALYVIARRAQLEDDLVALADNTDEFDLEELLAIDEDNDAIRRLEQVIRKLKSLSGSEVSLMKEMRELDNRLGLNPKAMAELRWSIDDEEEKPKSKAKPKAKPSGPRPVDPDAK